MKKGLYLSNPPIASTYSSMGAFWKDYELQQKGLSDGTIWDTYEHGKRRKLEKLFAKSYGSESALLLNSGMSAVAVVFGMMKLKKGDKIMIGKRNYFEISKFIKDWVEPFGVNILKVDVTNFQDVKRALKTKPKLVFVETVTNEPSLATPEKFELWPSLSPTSLFVIDNSIQSFNVRWFKKIRSPKNLIVLESATKYLTQECVAGLLYGGKALIDRARDFARDTGQQLQERAFNFISPNEANHIDKKLRLHARNVKHFVSILKNGLKDVDIKTVNALVFIKFKGCGPKTYRKIVDRWHKRSLVDIRAGFGWNATGVRVYESTKLNQSDAPNYIRISIGTESLNRIRVLAKDFVISAK